MPNPRNTTLRLAALSAATLALHASAAAQSQHAAARLIGETTALVPGQAAHIAITFKIEPDWHLYAPGPNDTGSPPEIDLQAPSGFTLGEPIWPAPHRYIADFDGLVMLDHIYESELTVIYPVQVPEGATEGSMAPFTAHLDWIICSEMCVFESADVSLKLPIAAQTGEPAKSDDASTFTSARARLPKPLPKEDPPVRVTFAKGKAVITAPQAAILTFYPDDKCVQIDDLAKNGHAKASALTLPLGAPTEEAGRLTGTLELRTAPKAKPQFWRIDADPAQPDRPTDTISEPTRKKETH